jgi:hypothetical protein
MGDVVQECYDDRHLPCFINSGTSVFRAYCQKGARGTTCIESCAIPAERGGGRCHNGIVKRSTRSPIITGISLLGQYLAAGQAFRQRQVVGQHVEQRFRTHRSLLDVDAENARRAPIRPEQSGSYELRSGFACTVGTDQPKERAGRYRQVDMTRYPSSSQDLSGVIRCRGHNERRRGHFHDAIHLQGANGKCRRARGLPLSACEPLRVRPGRGCGTVLVMI